ncbi:MAG: hypothetical protein JWP29_745 [Rhodoferax sp.]|nr:hypothetical protein [Rhodoferax sp.]
MRSLSEFTPADDQPATPPQPALHDAMPGHRLSLERIRRASRSISPVFRNTPQFDCEPLSKALGCQLTIKVETLNPIRCFKGRGADFFLQRLQLKGDATPLVCASAGNFGQALAYACRSRGAALDIFASVNVNPLKAERMQALGATLHLVGADFDEAKQAARAYCVANGARMVEDGLEVEISEGAGSIAVELLAAGQFYDAVLVPLGNGALLNGMARWIKATSPATRVIGVSAVGADAMERSWRSGSLVSNARVDTIADGVAVREPIAEAVADMRGLVDDVILVDDATLVTAMRLAYQHAGILLEPSGALGIGAVLTRGHGFDGQSIATVLCGANVTDDHVRQLILGDPPA